jgi:hypothetical protein
MAKFSQKQLFTPHVIHAVAPTPGIYVPAAHKQFEMDVDPTTEDDDPAGHKTQVLAPVTAEYAPAGHCTHVFALLAPVTPENAPAGHGTHVLELFAPVAFEYVPAGQFTHTMPDKYCPGVQVTV